MKWIVRRGVGEIMEERLSGCGVGFDGFDRVIGKRIRGVVVVGKVLDLKKGVVVSKDAGFASFEFWVRHPGIEEIAAARPKTISLIESAVEGAISHLFAVVPFAGHAGCVTGVAHGFAEGEHLLSDKIFLTTATIAGIETGEERRPSRGALGVVVKLSEQEPLGGEAIDVGRFDLRTVASDVGPAHVIDHDQQDVWPRRWSGHQGRTVDRQEQRNEGEQADAGVGFHGGIS